MTIWRGNQSQTFVIRENSMSYNWLESYEQRDMLQYLNEIESITLQGIGHSEQYELSSLVHDKIVSALYADVRDNSYIGWELFQDWVGDSTYELKIHMEDGSTEVLYIGEVTRNTYEWIKNYLLEAEGV